MIRIFQFSKGQTAGFFHSFIQKTFKCATELLFNNHETYLYNILTWKRTQQGFEKVVMFNECVKQKPVFPIHGSVDGGSFIYIHIQSLSDY